MSSRDLCSFLECHVKYHKLEEILKKKDYDQKMCSIGAKINKNNSIDNSVLFLK